MNRLLRVGLTGGIATGKTYVRTRLADRGVPTIDADTVAREVVEPATPGLAAIHRRFGDCVLLADGRLDRRALGDIVFADEAARHDLEAIVHPEVYAAIGRWFDELARIGRYEIAVADIPLLYETSHERDFDVVVVTACDPATQLKRLMTRDDASEEDARRRIAAQWPLTDKVQRADHVIWTDGTFEETERRIEEVHRRLVKRVGSGAA
jgi:dephospho-CoA kinase